MSGILDFIYDSELFVDLYTVLEIDMDAKQDEIKTAYIGLAKKNHPDHGGSSDKFQEITRAYEILYNKETRKEYDLYYLKKSMDEFKGDDILRLKDEYKNFISSNAKPISAEELNKLYSETFNEFREEYKETKINEKDLTNRLNDFEIERKNTQIETSDDSLANFIKEHGQDININDIFEFLKFKNSKCFNNNIVEKELGTLDSMPGYADGYSSFVSDDEHFGSNFYSNVSDMNNYMSKESMENLNYDEFIGWKNNKHQNTKLSESELNMYLEQRYDEQSKLYNEVESSLEKSSKRKEVEKFLKTKHLTEDIERYYENIDGTNSKIISKTKTNSKTNTNLKTKTNTNTNTNSSNLDDMLNYMEKIKLDEFSQAEPTVNSSKSEPTDFIDLKESINLPKINNVRKREFK